LSPGGEQESGVNGARVWTRKRPDLDVASRQPDAGLNARTGANGRLCLSVL
jgi:hypothetical protein